MWGGSFGFFTKENGRRKDSGKGYKFGRERNCASVKRMDMKGREGV